MRQAETRVLRTIGVLYGVASVVFGLLTLPTILDQSDDAPRAWTAFALVAVLGVPVLLGATASFAPAATIQTLGALAAVGGVLALASEPLASTAPTTAAQSSWLLQLTALGTTGGALVLPARLVVADVVLTAAFVGLDRVLAASTDIVVIAVQDGLYSGLFCGVFAALVVGSIRAGRTVDASAASAATAVRAARDQRVRAEERQRVNGLVHDHVLTSLLVAARGTRASPEATAEAADTLQRLRALTDPESPRQPVDVAELVARLRAQLTTAAPEGGFVVVVVGEKETALPPRAADALVGAAGEALRNSVRHGGADVAVEVHVTLTDGTVEVAVVDDGVGFQPDAVPTDRLGISTSIEARVRRVGGAAEVRSQRGVGTAVRLRWSDQ